MDSLFGPFALTSLTLVEDEVGVAALELLGERESPPSVVEEERGEAVPEALSFFLDDLFESLALDSCSCYAEVSHRQWSSSEGLCKTLDRIVGDVPLSA